MFGNDIDIHATGDAVAMQAKKLPGYPFDPVSYNGITDPFRNRDTQTRFTRRIRTDDGEKMSAVELRAVL